MVEVAPPELLKITCKRCGVVFETPRKPGRRPAYCPEHSRRPSVIASEFGYQSRAKRRKETQAQQEAAQEPLKVARLAAAMRLYDDPVQAAKLFGVLETGEALDALIALARANHENLISGDMRDTARLAESVVHLMLLELVDRRHELPVRDLSNAARAAMQIQTELIGDGPATNYVGFELVCVPPPEDRKLTPEQLAKVRGTDVLDEELTEALKAPSD